MSVNGRKKLVKLSCKFVQTKKPAHKCSNDPSFTKGNVQLVITHIAFVRKRHAIKLFFSFLSKQKCLTTKLRGLGTFWLFFPPQTNSFLPGGEDSSRQKYLKNRKVKSKKSQC